MLPPRPPPGALLQALLRNQISNVTTLPPLLIGAAVGVVGALVPAPVVFIGAIQATGNPLQEAGAALQPATGAVLTSAGTLAVPVPTIVGRAQGVLTTTVQQVINVALSPLISGVVGGLVVLNGLSTAAANLAATGNLGAFVTAVIAAEIAGLTVAVNTVTGAVQTARTKIHAALNEPTAVMLSPMAPKTPAALATKALAAVPTIKAPQLPSAPAKRAVALATQVGTSSVDVGRTVVTAQGTVAKTVVGGTENVAAVNGKDVGAAVKRSHAAVSKAVNDGQKSVQRAGAHVRVPPPVSTATSNARTRPSLEFAFAVCGDRATGCGRGRGNRSLARHS